MKTPLWQCLDPKTTNIHAFRLYVNQTFGLRLQSFHELNDWSVNNVARFAEAIWNFAGIVYHSPPARTMDGGDAMYPPPTWFPDATLNYAENLLSPGLSSRPDAIAVTACQENSQHVEHLTWKQLERRTAIWAHALQRLGVGINDRVAVVLPNRLDCLLALLATTSLGAIFSASSPDMGARSIIERYSQLKPKVIIIDTSIQYSGKTIDLCTRMTETLQELSHLVPELQHILIANGKPLTLPNSHLVSDILDPTHQAPLTYEPLPFDHPVYVLYSSGTTGPPKCIVHAAGRALLQQKKEHLLHLNLTPNSTHYQYTTTGWMMWVHMVAALSVGARILLFDGSPLFPRPSAQLDLIRHHAITSWGTSPKFLDALRREELPSDLRLDSLTAVQTAGSPLSAELHHWFQHAFGSKIGLFSCSGGTDLVGGIVGGNPALDLYAGEISGAFLGMKVEIWDSEGRDVSESGDAGDLVITKPFFSMPLTFLGEQGEAKYRKAYFETFPGVWYHGDYARRIQETGGYEILGRSDGILNPGGELFLEILFHFEALTNSLPTLQVCDSARRRSMAFSTISRKSKTTFASDRNSLAPTTSRSCSS